MGASAATNTTGHPLRQIKIPWRWVSCAEQRWCTFIYMVALKKMVCKDSGPARLGSGWLGHREGGAFGRFSRGAWEINRAAFKLAWPGLAWLGLVSAGVGDWGEGAACPLPPKHTPDPIAGCDAQLL